MKTRLPSSVSAIGAFAIAVFAPLAAQAAKVIGVAALDKDYLAVQISDGDAHQSPGEVYATRQS